MLKIHFQHYPGVRFSVRVRHRALSITFLARLIAALRKGGSATT